MALPSHIQKRVDRYEPIQFQEITLHPIKVREIEEFTSARQAIECVQQSLPIRFWGIPLLQAYFKMDIEAVLERQQPIGMFSRAVAFLVLALRLGEGLTMEERIRMMTPVVDPNDPTNLQELRYKWNGEEQRTITPVMFQQMRPILAAQNGIELVSDDANPELLEAERDIADARGVKLDYSLHGMMSTISTLSGKTMKEMDEWTIHELMDKQADYNRVLHYITCAIAEGSGAKWKGGNPYPSPFFERIQTSSSALISMDDFAGGAGYSAMQNASQ